MSLIEHYHLLVDDRIGSRVGDRCWASADPYLKEKIGRSLIPQEQFLAASYYGKYFARNLHLQLLKRRPDDWKAMQSKSGAPAQSTGVTRPLKTSVANVQPDSIAEVAPELIKGKRKREAKPEDEIDVLFTAGLGKKSKKGNLTSAVIGVQDPPDVGSPNRQMTKHNGKGTAVEDLSSVFGAIRAAPKDLKGAGTKRGH